MVNHSKKMYNHRTGSRPFSYIVEEMAKDDMLVKVDEYLLQKAKEQLPEDTPLEEIPIDDPEAGLNIMMSVLGEKLERQIRGLGYGRLRNIRTTSHVCNLEQELEVKRTARCISSKDGGKIFMLLLYRCINR